MIELLPQANDVNEPHVPASNCTRTWDGAEEIVIVCVDAWATNWYHTSALSDAPQPSVGMDVGFQVALTFVPAVLTQLVEDVKVIAFEH